MTKYRTKLPQLGGGLFLTDGGIETTLIFHEGLEIPDFAAFHLLKTQIGTRPDRGRSRRSGAAGGAREGDLIERVFGEFRENVWQWRSGIA